MDKLNHILVTRSNESIEVTKSIGNGLEPVLSALKQFLVDELVISNVHYEMIVAGDRTLRNLVITRHEHMQAIIHSIDIADDNDFIRDRTAFKLSNKVEMDAFDLGDLEILISSLMVAGDLSYLAGDLENHGTDLAKMPMVLLASIPTNAYVSEKTDLQPITNVITNDALYVGMQKKAANGISNDAIFSMDDTLKELDHLAYYAKDMPENENLARLNTYKKPRDNAPVLTGKFDSVDIRDEDDERYHRGFNDNLSITEHLENSLFLTPQFAEAFNQVSKRNFTFKVYSGTSLGEKPSSLIAYGFNGLDINTESGGDLSKFSTVIINVGNMNLLVRELIEHDLDADTDSLESITAKHLQRAANQYFFGRGEAYTSVWTETTLTTKAGVGFDVYRDDMTQLIVKNLKSKLDAGKILFAVTEKSKGAFFENLNAVVCEKTDKSGLNPSYTLLIGHGDVVEKAIVGKSQGLIMHCLFNVIADESDNDNYVDLSNDINAILTLSSCTEFGATKADDLLERLI